MKTTRTLGGVIEEQARSVHKPQVFHFHLGALRLGLVKLPKALTRPSVPKPKINSKLINGW